MKLINECKIMNELIMKLMKEFINKWINEKKINKINQRI